jgi:hypothetical protein
MFDFSWKYFCVLCISVAVFSVKFLKMYAVLKAALKLGIWILSGPGEPVYASLLLFTYSQVQIMSRVSPFLK